MACRWRTIIWVIGVGLCLPTGLLAPAASGQSRGECEKSTEINSCVPAPGCPPRAEASKDCPPRSPPGPTTQPPTGPASETSAQQKTLDTLARFANRRNDLLLSNEPDGNRELDRLDGGDSEAASNRVAQPIKGTSVAFATGLSQLASPAAPNPDAPGSLADAMMGLGAVNARAAAAVRRKFDIWVEGQYSTYDETSGGAALDGVSGVYFLGADYIVNPALLIGALAQFDTVGQRSRALATDVDGQGRMAGPYAMLRLSSNVFLQGRAMWGQSSTSISRLSTEADDFEGERWLARSALIGRWQLGAIEFRPSASIAFVSESTNEHTDSAGAEIPSLRVSLGQAKFGPEFAYTHRFADGTLIEPRWSLQGVWNVTQDTTGVVAGTTAGTDELRGRVDVGVRGRLTNGISLDVSGGYDGLGISSYEAVSGRLQVRVPLQ